MEAYLATQQDVYGTKFIGDLENYENCPQRRCSIWPKQSGQIAQNGLAKLKVSFTTFTLNFGSTFSDCDILEKNPISLGRGHVKKLHLYRRSSVGYVKMMMTFR